MKNSLFVILILYSSVSSFSQNFYSENYKFIGYIKKQPIFRVFEDSVVGVTLSDRISTGTLCTWIPTSSGTHSRYASCSTISRIRLWVFSRNSVGKWGPGGVFLLLRADSARRGYWPFLAIQGHSRKPRADIVRTCPQTLLNGKQFGFLNRRDFGASSKRDGA